MADEPSNGELGRLIAALQGETQRRMDTLNVRLGEFVPQILFEQNNRYLTESISRLHSELQRALEMNSKLEDDFEQYQRDEAKRREAERQGRLYQMVVPVFLGLLSSAIAIWAVSSK
jgi:hypothetical protein